MVVFRFITFEKQQLAFEKTVPFIFYILASLELIAEAIEDPFGTDADDLPIEKMAVNIKKHVGELI